MLPGKSSNNFGISVFLKQPHRLWRCSQVVNLSPTFMSRTAHMNILAAIFTSQKFCLISRNFNQIISHPYNIFLVLQKNKGSATTLPLINKQIKNYALTASFTLAPNFTFGASLAGIARGSPFCGLRPV